MQTTGQALEARIAIEPGFAWNGQDADLFDIDDALLRSRDRVRTGSVLHDTPRHIANAQTNFLPVPAVFPDQARRNDPLESKLEAGVSSLSDLTATVKGRA